MLTRNSRFLLLPMAFVLLAPLCQATTESTGSSTPNSSVAASYALTPEAFDRMIAVNLKGVWLCCKAVAPVFKQQRSGVIVNISSGTILGGTPGFMHYVSSKGAVWAMTRCLANELGEFGVRVNCITPGLTSSERAKEVYPQKDFEDRAQSRLFKREQVPEDLVGTMVFLCSDASQFVTGQTLNVDGGANMH